jgi:hypothetical protein
LGADAGASPGTDAGFVVGVRSGISPQGFLLPVTAKIVHKEKSGALCERRIGGDAIEIRFAGQNL